MDKLLSAKPFVPQGTGLKNNEINANAAPFIPKFPEATPAAPIFEKSNTKRMPDKKVKTVGKKSKANGARMNEKSLGSNITAANAPVRTVVIATTGAGSSAGVASSKLAKAEGAEQKKKQKSEPKRREKSSREDEMRLLTSQLREKEEQLKQLEAQREQESQVLVAAQAKKVEEEVAQRLFRASLLTSMYKNATSAPVVSQEPAAHSSSKSSKSSKQSTNSSCRSGGMSDGRGRLKEHARGAAGAGGGVLRVPTDTSSGSNKKGREVSQKAAGLSGDKAGRRDRDGRCGAYELSAEELQQQGLSREAKELATAQRRIATMEMEVKDILNKIRQSKPLLQDFCLLGIERGAPVEFNEKSAVLQEHYTDQLLMEARRVADTVGLASSDAGSVGTEAGAEVVGLERWARRLCELRGKQVGLIRQVLEKAELKGGIDSAPINQIRVVYLNELRQAVELLLTIVHPLEQILVEKYTMVRVGVAGADSSDCGDKLPPLPQSSQEKHVRSALQTLFSEIASLGRQQVQQMRLESPDAPPRDHELRAEMEAQVLVFRQRALSVAPHDGSSYEALSKLAFAAGDGDKDHRSKDSFLCAYFLVRGMSAEVPYLAARENLLDIFEDQKTASDRFENVTALSRLTLEEHIRRFKVHFLAAVGVAYSRTGADRLSYHLTKARRHVGTMLQLVSTAQLCNQNRGSKGSFSAFEQQKAFQRQGQEEAGLGFGLAQLGQCREVDTSLCHALVITLSLIAKVGAAHDISAVNKESKWAGAYSNWIEQKDEDEEWTLQDHVAHIPTEERRAVEKRYALQRLHKVQSIPGLMDLLTLLVGLLSSLLGTESIGSVLDSERKEGLQSLKREQGRRRGPVEVTPRSLTTTRMLAMFFEWLETNPQYHAAIAAIDVVCWEAVEIELPQLVSGLRSLVDPPSTDSPPFCGVMKDDFDLMGFVPLQESLAASTTTLAMLEREALQSLCATPTAPPSLEALHDQVVGKLLTFEQHTVLWVCRYATRCCRAIRNLCECPLRLGELTFQFHSDTGKRETQYPCDESEAVAALAVIEYNSVARPSQFAGFNNVLGKTQGLGSRQTYFVLSKEEFMSGAVVPDADVEDEEEDDEEVPESGGGDTAGDLSSLSDGGEGEDHDDDDARRGAGDDDLDLSNLVLEDDEEAGHALPPPPPGFMPLSKAPAPPAYTFDSSADFNADDDFAAMCAALLTVPLTDSSEAAGTDKISKEKGKGGLLHVTVPPKSQPYSTSDSNLQMIDVKRVGPSSKAPSSYGSSALSSQRPGRGSEAVSSVYSSMRLNSSGDIPLIVVDAPNVAMRHGLNAKFSCQGIKLALNFFHSAGHKVIAFLPDHYLNFERVGELRRLARLNLGDVRASQLPDDVEVLQQLVQQGVVIGTPSQDYDDSYCITYAQRRGGYIISNDMYRDHVKRIESKGPREEARKWIKSHVISYTFVGNEFLPNPDAAAFAR